LFRFSVIALGSLVVLGCSKDRTDDCAPPPPVVSAFRLELRADRGTLPAGTELKVTYGGDQTESFTVGRPSPVNEDVCCRPARSATSGALPPISCLPPDAGEADASAPDAGSAAVLECELWTNGTAGIQVTAPGFPELDRVLDAKLRADNCGVETKDYRIVLFHADAGQ